MEFMGTSKKYNTGGQMKLDDKFTEQSGPVCLTGIQALVRAPLIVVRLKPKLQLRSILANYWFD